MNLITKINVSLASIIVILLVNLLLPLNSIAGKVVYALDSSEPSCMFNNKNISTEIPLDYCCSEIEKQLACKKDNSQFRCYISESSGQYYLVNRQAFNTCKEEGYYAKIQE
ncbi:hypothetical protein J4417_03020 [Candidatus Woesearchaeota archaeon]|nr:hypothetical protein [Candidatus Woesearchaeota archaeon]